MQTLLYCRSCPCRVLPLSRTFPVPQPLALRPGCVREFDICWEQFTWPVAFMSQLPPPVWWHPEDAREQDCEPESLVLV